MGAGRRGAGRGPSPGGGPARGGRRLGAPPVGLGRGAKSRPGRAGVVLAPAGGGAIHPGAAAGPRVTYPRPRGAVGGLEWPTVFVLGIEQMAS